MGTICALLVDFVIRDFVWFLTDNNQANKLKHLVLPQDI